VCDGRVAAFQYVLYLTYNYLNSVNSVLIRYGILSGFGKITNFFGPELNVVLKLLPTHHDHSSMMELQESCF
jgi:hypothetical protein